MAEEILRLPPGTLKGWSKQGGIEVVSPPKVDVARSSDRVAERAAALFGEDFLGEQAIHLMEDKCHVSGINVKFEIPTTPFHLTEAQLEEAKRDENKGKARLVVLRPEFMEVRGERKSVTLLNLKHLLGNKNPFGNGKVFYKQDWYHTEAFAQEGLKAKYALPTKEVVPGSLGKNWNDQEKLVEPGESRREAVEAVWDMLLYYAATGKKIMETKWDWTKTQTSDRGLVHVGGFDSEGLVVDGWKPDNVYSALGVCLSR